jgi:hypothetical protein
MPRCAAAEAQGFSIIFRAVANPQTWINSTPPKKRRIQVLRAFSGTFANRKNHYPLRKKQLWTSPSSQNKPGITTGSFP